jgi:hypothetical protein
MCGGTHPDPVQSSRWGGFFNKIDSRDNCGGYQEKRKYKSFHDQALSQPKDASPVPRIENKKKERTIHTNLFQK